MKYVLGCIELSSHFYRKKIKFLDGKKIFVTKGFLIALWVGHAPFNRIVAWKYVSNPFKDWSPRCVDMFSVLHVSTLLSTELMLVDPPAPSAEDHLQGKSDI